MAVDCVVQVDHLNRMFQLSAHNFSITTSTSVKRTGHARFRRAPCSDSNGPSVSSQSDKASPSPSLSESRSSTSSGLEGSVSNGKSLGIVAPAPAFSSRKPPLPLNHRKICSADRPVVSSSLHRSGSVSRSGYHCCKRRKTGSKREIRRVPITGSKITSIPSDDYSWKKYGEKKVVGSPYPKVYYKCSTGKGCPARKCVELSLDDTKMLLVTYDGEHRHHPPTPVPVSLTGAVVV